MPSGQFFPGFFPYVKKVFNLSKNSDTFPDSLKRFSCSVLHPWRYKMEFSDLSYDADEVQIKTVKEFLTERTDIQPTQQNIALLCRMLDQLESGKATART